MVAISTTCFTVMSGGTFVSRARSRWKINMRCSRKAVRIWVKNSDGTSVSTSLLSESGIFRSSVCWNGGTPCPISISTGAAMETPPPESAISFHSSGVRLLQWI